MQWWRSKLCPCRVQAPSSITPNTTSQTSLAEDNNDWEVIFESSGHEAGFRSTTALQSQPARTRSQRTNLLDPNDPRRNAACWPCFGKHIVQKGSNRYGSWTKCARCSVRLSYQTKENSSSSTSQSEVEVQVIAAALARLRRTQAANDEISADAVNAMIKIIQGERALTASLSQWCFHNQCISLNSTLPTKRHDGFWIGRKSKRKKREELATWDGFANSLIPVHYIPSMAFSIISYVG